MVIRIVRVTTIPRDQKARMRFLDVHHFVYRELRELQFATRIDGKCKARSK